MKRIFAMFRQLHSDERGGVFAEYILLLTIVGVGAIVGVAAVRTALVQEFGQIAPEISQIILP